MLVMIGFNLFFSPLVPLTMHWRIRGKSSSRLITAKCDLGLGGVCHWLGADGQTGHYVDYRVILALLTLGVASMLLGFSSVRRFSHKGQAASRRAPVVSVVGAGSPELALSGLRLFIQGAHAAYYGFSAIYWQAAGYRPRRWGICGRWAWWRKSLSCAE